MCNVTLWATAKPPAINDGHGRRNFEPVEDYTMSIGTILLVLLVLMLVGSFPAWPHSREWGYAPSGAFSVVLIILVVLLLTGRV